VACVGLNPGVSRSDLDVTITSQPSCTVVMVPTANTLCQAKSPSDYIPGNSLRDQALGIASETRDYVLETVSGVLEGLPLCIVAAPGPGTSVGVGVNIDGTCRGVGVAVAPGTPVATLDGGTPILPSMHIDEICYTGPGGPLCQDAFDTPPVAPQVLLGTSACFAVAPMASQCLPLP
jgi:hypothetical protein